jgi:FkbM family methyltransferase
LGSVLFNDSPSGLAIGTGGAVTNDSTSLHEETRVRFVDVGAMGGLQPKWRPHTDRILPILFEPNPEEARRLRASAPNAIVVEAALSSTVGKRALVITENPTCVSLRYPNDHFLLEYGIRPHFRVKKTLATPCTRYDVLHQQGTVPAPDAIKLDVQGCEFEVLLGFGVLLQHCIGIELEAHFYPLYRDQHLLHDIVSLLHAHGFVLRKLDQNKMDNFEGDLVEVDAYFTKPRTTVMAYDAIERGKFDLLTQVWGLATYT